MSPAREIAFRVLQKVAAGGYATDLLRRETGETRDLALAESIVLGCLRYQGQLDHLITVFSGRSVNSTKKCASPCTWASSNCAISIASRPTPPSANRSSS
ncbi:MAG: transcription antitermination factor NusB [Acidobacteriota bacterium]